MPFEFIQISANVQGSAKEELNKHLRGGRIASVRKESGILVLCAGAFWGLRPAAAQEPLPNPDIELVGSMDELDEPAPPIPRLRTAGDQCPGLSGRTSGPTWPDRGNRVVTPRCPPPRSA